MAYSKKDQTLSIRLPEKTKKMIEDSADKNTRSLQDEILVLIGKGLHQGNYNPKTYI